MSAARMERWEQASQLNEAIQRMKRAGATNEDISKRFGVSVNYVRRIAA